MLGLLLACAPGLAIYGGADPTDPTALTAQTGATAETGVEATHDTGPAEVPSCWVPLPDGTSLCLSEVQSDDESTFPLAPGTFPDWIEVVNTGATAIDPARIRLDVGGTTVDGLSGAPLAPGAIGFWVADGQALDGHVPALVSASGERITLRVDGALADEWDVPPLARDLSWHRDPASSAPASTCAPSPGEPNPPTWPCVDVRERVFALGSIVDLRLYVDAPGYATLQTSELLTYYPEVAARLVFDTPAGPGEFPLVGLALKGGYGSFRNQLDYQKASFKVDLNAFADHRWRGLQKLQLNNEVQDATMVHEYLTYALFRAVGIPAPRVAYARVWLNDVYFGFYALIEPVDDGFLRQWYADDSGHLLEAAYGPDFDLGDELAFEYDQGPDPVAGRALVTEVALLLAGAPWDEATYQSLRTLVDMDEWMTNMAVEAAVWHWDGYWTENNYYLYEDPTTGLLQILPHGTDQTWTDGWPNAWDPGEQAALYHFCLSVPSCAAMYEQRVLEVADAVDALGLEPTLDALVALTEPEWLADPRIEDRTSRAWRIDATRARIDTVSQALRDLAAVH